jgi:undecaprenyl-diphosphatase
LPGVGFRLVIHFRALHNVDGVIVTPPAPSSVLADPRLLPAGLRRPAVVVAAGSAVVLGLLALLVGHTSAPTAFDVWGEHLVRGLHVLPDGWTDIAVAAGDPVFVVAVAVVVAAWCAWRRQWRPAAVVVAGPGLTGVAELVLKALVGRTIGAGDLAFPSGHTAGSAALVLALTLVVAAVLQGRREPVLAVGALAGVAVAVVVAVGLVAERAHYPTDTIGGFSLAVVMSIVAALAIDGFADARRGRRPAA